MRQEINWFRVRSVEHLSKAIAVARSYKKICNTSSGLRHDKNGNPFVMFGYNSRPDSDWGNFKGYKFAIWFANQELATAGIPQAEKAILGWTSGPVEEVAQ